MSKKQIKKVNHEIRLVQRKRLIFVSLIVALLGILTIVFALASSSFSSLEAEDGTPSGISQLNIPSASGGQAIQFGSVTQASGQFTLQGSTIIDPDGKEFIPIGANVNGPHMWWPGATIGYANIAKDRWNWNAIRLITCYDGCLTGYNWSTNNDLDALVEEYTSKKIVVVIDNHQAGHTQNQPYNPTYASQSDINWWKDVANRFKNNPYVWFELGNETHTGAQLDDWYNFYDQLAAAITSTGAQNIMVASANYVGQDIVDYSTCGPNLNTSASGILNRGPQLKSKYPNMMFDWHVYSIMGVSTCSDTQLNARLNGYIDKVKAAGLAMFIGEFQGLTDPSRELSHQSGQTRSANTIFRVAPGRKIGGFWFTGSAGSQPALSDLIAPGVDWYNINESRSNISIWGQKLLDYANAVNN